MWQSLVEALGLPSEPLAIDSLRKRKKIARLGWHTLSVAIRYTTQEKTAAILRRYHLFPREMKSKKRAQKFHTDDVLVPRSGKFLWLNEPNFQPITSTSQIWVVTHHQYGISALVSRTSFCGETSGGVAECKLFSQAYDVHVWSSQVT